MIIASPGISSKELVTLNPVDSQDDFAHVLINEDDEKQSSFAEILAGLLNGSVTPADLDDAQHSFDTIFVDSENENKLDFFANAMSEAEPEYGLKTAFSGVIQTGLMSGNEQADETHNVFFNTEEIPAVSLGKTAFAEETGDLSSKIFDESSLKNETALREAASREATSLDLDTVKTQTNQNTEHVLAEQKHAGTEKQSDNHSRADRAASENAQIVPSKEHASSHNKREESSFTQGQPAENRLDEQRSRRRDRIAFEVRDQRTAADMAHNTQTHSLASAETALNSTQSVTLELRLPDFNNAGQNAQTTWEVKPNFSSALENMLARELHNNFNGDIVRHASMALRDGGESIIKLSLKPESLGNVKIRLEMVENKITGIILVESEEALNAFKKELASLEQSFRESGFADANLDLSLASDGRNAWQEHEKNVLTAQLGASGYEDSLREIELGTEALIDVFFRRADGGGSTLINVLA